MGRRNWVWGVLAALTAANTVSATVTATPRAAFRHIYALAADGRVTIQNPYGNVTITACGLGSRRSASGSDQTHQRSPAYGRRPHCGGPGSGFSVDSDAIYRRRRGASHQCGISSDGAASRSSGRSAADRARKGGASPLAGLAGPVQAQAINGDIHALKMGGATQLSTVNGRVEANFDSTAPGHSISLSSVNGGIALTLPGGSDANLEAENRSGGIASNLGHVMRTGAGDRLVMRGGGPRIRLHNINGGISIRSERPCT